MSIEGKKIFITGSSGGIGAAICNVFLNKNCVLVLSSSSDEKLENLKKLYGNKHSYYNLDLSNIDTEWNKIKNGSEKIFLAYKERKLIAGLRLGCFNKTAHTNFVINSYDTESNLGGTLLTWYAVEWAKTNNFGIYDFSGGRVAASLLSYKKKWG